MRSTDVPPRRAPIVSASGAWNAFKNFAIIFSFITNFILVIVLLMVLLVLPIAYGPIKAGVLEPLVTGLHGGFGRMNEAHITRTIEVRDTVPAKFDLALDQTTVVELTEPVALNVPVVVSLGLAGQINGTANLTLPSGTKLPVHLALTVPVSETIPVNIKVGVDIPLNETPLGPEFSQFQKLFEPLNSLVLALPDDWDGLVSCTLAGKLISGCFK